MSQSTRSEARLKARSQLVKRQEELKAREARIRTEVLDATAALLKRDRAILEAETRLGQALARLTSAEGLPVDEAAELCGTDIRAAKRLLRTQSRTRAAAAGRGSDQLMKRAVLDVAELVGNYGRFVSYPQAAEITSLSVRSLKRETAAGNLPCYRLGSARVFRVKTEDVAALIQRVA